MNEKYHSLCPDEKKFSFLVSAASRNYHKELIKLIQDIPFSQSELTKALDYSSSSCDVFTVKILLDAGAVFNEENISILINAVEDENTEVAAFLIHELGNINIVDGMGFSLLHHTSSVSRDQDFLTYLLYKGLDVNKQDNYGRTALMHTLLSIELDPENWFVEFGEKLLGAGADPNMHDNEGCTVLMMACKYEGYTLYGDEALIEFMKMLIHNGADVSIQNNQGQTALDIVGEGTSV
ncbi:ankyrin repeat domain-containing protein [Falsibacillus pallidus]|uniref:Ankyrin repeat protein n=1 Tax=Falsibacillus pallidus TaxID=493781 RepID=A0A370GCV3_9BACI|nr:ankyrin repeat domain-containing protein [Falsibacillus pallidus]RDI41662.1 ankyrin repeat protein [Falsibacillus pallidus]